MERFLRSARKIHLFLQTRGFTDCCKPPPKKGLVLGAYDGCKPGDLLLTPAGDKFDAEVSGKLKELLTWSNIELGKATVFHNLSCDFYAVAVAGLGPQGPGYNPCENINECKENIRIAAGVGARALQKFGVTDILVEGFTDAESAAEGSSLAVWSYQDYRSPLNRTPESSLCLYDDPDMAGWERGVFKAEAQNIARKLEDTPPNAMTPAIFSQEAMEILCPCEVQVVAHDRDWLEDKCMNAFITLARSSCDPPIMLELSYCGGAEDDKPVVIVGKGTTFDCGGLCLQRSGDMSECRADMAGAAVIVATLKALAMLKVPINVNALIPLYENMPGGMAIKPGDVVTGLCGKNIRVTDTSKEARVILTDPLTFSSNYKPCLVINVATLTAGVRTALGTSSTGVFTTSDVVWNELSRAGAETGDRVWRLPLWKHFTSNIKSYDSVDVDNVGNGRGGDPCVGAAFLREFAPPIDFLHLDITGTGMLASDPSHPYLREGYMTGRPTRTLVQFLYQMACPMDKSDDGR